MNQYGYLRPWGQTSSEAHVYGNKEGITKKIPNISVDEINNGVTLSYNIKTQGIVNSTGDRSYKFSIGLGNLNNTTHSNFIVKASQEIVSSINTPTTFSISF